MGGESMCVRVCEHACISVSVKLCRALQLSFLHTQSSHAHIHICRASHRSRGVSGRPGQEVERLAKRQTGAAPLDSLKWHTLKGGGKKAEKDENIPEDGQAEHTFFQSDKGSSFCLYISYFNIEKLFSLIKNEFNFSFEYLV